MNEVQENTMELQEDLSGYRLVVALPARYKLRRVSIEITTADNVYEEPPGINMSATGTFSPEGVSTLIEALQLAQNIALGKVVIK